MQAIPLVDSAYTQDQLERYLQVIRYYDHPNCRVNGDGKARYQGQHAPTLENLIRVSKLHLVEIMYENTPMHYTSSYEMDVTLPALFQRIVVDRQGSLCSGLNRILLEMLRAMGYAACSVSGRNNLGEEPDCADKPLEFGPSTHVLIFVQLPPDQGRTTNDSLSSVETWVVDFGFGASTPVRPFLLQAGNEFQGATATERHRLVCVDNTGGSLSDWYFQIYHTKSPENEPADPALRKWRTLFTFQATPSAADHPDEASRMLTHGPDTNLFRKTVLCVRHFFASSPPDFPPNSQGADISAFLSEFQKEADADDMGRVIMYKDTVRLTAGRRSCELSKMKSEEERREALRSYFGIHVSQADLRHIGGREAALAFGVTA